MAGWYHKCNERELGQILGDSDLGWEDPLEDGMPTHSSFLAWRIPMDRGVWWGTVRRVTKSQTRLSD